MGNSVRGIFNTYLNKLGLSWPNLAMPKPDFSDHSVFGFPPPQHGPLVETASCEATLELLSVCPSARLSQKGSLELLASVPFVRQVFKASLACLSEYVRHSSLVKMLLSIRPK